MFCNKCGKMLNDGDAFCSACGSPAERAEQPVAAQTVYQEPAQPEYSTILIPKGLITIPDISGLVTLGLSVLMFIFMLCPWFKYGFKFYGNAYFRHYTIFTNELTNLNVAIDIAKIFGIISIIVFIVYVILQFFDIKKLVPAIPETIDLKKYSAYAFGGVYVLQWIFALIAIISTGLVGVSICFIFAIIFVALFAVAVLMPNLLDMLLKDVLKIKKD